MGQMKNDDADFRRLRRHLRHLPVIGVICGSYSSVTTLLPSRAKTNWLPSLTSRSPAEKLHLKATGGKSLNRHSQLVHCRDR